MNALLSHTRRVFSVATGTSDVYWSSLNSFSSGSSELLYETMSCNYIKTLIFKKTPNGNQFWGPQIPIIPFDQIRKNAYVIHKVNVNQDLFLKNLQRLFFGEYANESNPNGLVLLFHILLVHNFLLFFDRIFKKIWTLHVVKFKENLELSHSFLAQHLYYYTSMFITWWTLY